MTNISLLNCVAISLVLTGLIEGLLSALFAAIACIQMITGADSTILTYNSITLILAAVFCISLALTIGITEALIKEVMK